jgi:type III secretion protein J
MFKIEIKNSRKKIGTQTIKQEGYEYNFYHRVDMLNDILRQKIKSLFSHTSFTITFLLVLATIVFPSCESRKTIVNGIDEREANEIVVFLSGKNIDAYKIPTKESNAGGGGPKIILYDIAVDSSKATEAMSILSANGLPRRPGQHLLDIFSAGGLVPSEMQEQIRYQSGLAAQIASTIRKIDGVIDADVQLSIPKEDALNPNAPKQPVTASVYVKHTGVLDDPNSHLITKIKRLVASSVPGLDFDNVTVIPDRARFAEITPMISREPTSEMDYVQVWSVVVAKDSLFRFQTLFFTFSIFLLILFLCSIWLGWKLYPLLMKRGGLKKLFSVHALPDTHEETMEKKEADEKSKDEQKSDQKGPKIQENIENT